MALTFALTLARNASINGKADKISGWLIRPK